MRFHVKFLAIDTKNIFSFFKDIITIMTKRFNFDIDERVFSKMRENICELYALKRDASEFSTALGMIECLSVINTKTAFFERFDAVWYFEELLIACLITAEKKGYELSVLLPRFPFFTSADFRVLRAAALEMLSFAFSVKRKTEVIFDAEKNGFSLIVSPFSDDYYTVCEKAAELHSGEFFKRRNSAVLTIPSKIFAEYWNNPITAFEYIENAFSPVRSGLILI